MKSVVIITPTTGSPILARCLKSVQSQTYQNIRHLVVVDGQKFAADWISFDQEHSHLLGKTTVVQLPWNTGGVSHGNVPTFYGHRIYAGFSHLVNEDVVIFLDQDNTIEPDHVSELMKVLEDPSVWVAFSLRNIYDKDSNFLCKDDCEGLGKWPVWNNQDSYHIDISCYAIRRDFLIRIASNLHNGYFCDRIFFKVIRQYLNQEEYETTGKYTLNYFLGSNESSASPDFFLEGNKRQEQMYNMLRQEFPWRR